MTQACEQRILAIDLHPRSFGFAAFEGSQLILDWGARSFRGGVNKVRVPLRAKLGILLAGFAPDAIVLERPRTAKLARIIGGIKAEAKIHKVAVRLVSRKAIEQAFLGRNDNKDQIASVIAERFPELLFALPPKRRPWQSEDYRMSIFDAAAVGTAYFGRKAVIDPAILPNVEPFQRPLE
jgi:hypothetical protein